jgi:hypothetical protein
MVRSSTRSRGPRYKKGDKNQKFEIPGPFAHKKSESRRSTMTDIAPKTCSLFPANDVEFRPPLSPSKPPPEQNEAFFQLLCRMRIACHVLELKLETRFVSIVLLHRFAQSKTTTEPVTSMVAAACLLLGCKVEDDLRRLRDIVNIEAIILGHCRFDLVGDDHQGVESTTRKEEGEISSSAREIWIRSTPPALNDKYWKSKESLVATEQDVLRVLQFDCSVPHPHRAVSILLMMNEGASIKFLIQEAWRYLDNSLFYSAALQHEVLPMACAAILLAVEDSDEESARPSEWKMYAAETLWWHDYGVKDLQVEFAKRDLKQAARLYASKTFIS